MAPQKEPEVEGSPWVLGHNAEGYPYYCNQLTGESVWELPEGGEAQLPPGISISRPG